MDVLATYNLAVGYGHGSKAREVLGGMNLRLPEATMTVIVGANGIGKSTLLRTLSGARRPLGGKIEIMGEDAAKISPRRRARLLSMVYTDRGGGGGLTVSETVALGRQPYTGFLGRLSADDRCVVGEAMDAVGVSAMAARYMATLSDGERQKVMIARALAQQTPLIVLDEPTAFLDVASRLEIMRLLARLVSDEGKTVLLSTHDIAPALEVAGRLWVVDGERRRIVEGTVSELIESEVMESVFPGRGVTFDTSLLDFRIK